MTQVSASIRTPIEAAPGGERSRDTGGKREAAGGFAELVKDAGTGGRGADKEPAAQKAGLAGDGAVREGDEVQAKAGQEQGQVQPADKGATGADHGETAGKTPDTTSKSDAAKPSSSKETAQPVNEDGATQVPPGPAPIVAVMAVAPYLTARITPADTAAKPAAPQRSGVSVDLAAAKGQAASSRAETIEIAFAAGSGGREPNLRSAGPQAGGGQQMAGRAGSASVDGPAIAVGATAAPSAGGEPRLPQPVVVPLDLGRALAGEGDLPASMREVVSSHVARVMATPIAGQPVSVLRIQLQPAHLGQINVTMRMSGEQMTVTLTPDSAAAARALGSDQETIATVLRAVGGSFAGANIEVAGEGQIRTGGDDAASRGLEGRQGDRSGADDHSASTGGQGIAGGDGGDPDRSAVHNGDQASSGEGRIII